MKLGLFVLRWVVVGLGIAGVAVVALQPELLRELGRRLAAPIAATKPGYAIAVRRAAPAVVGIHAETRVGSVNNPLTADPLFQSFFGAKPGAEKLTSSTSLGSGVLLSPEGLVLTNYHVVRAASAIRVSLHDGRSTTAEILGSDPETDLAVLRIGLTDLPDIPLGDSDTLDVGDVVLAIGNALGIGQTVTQGIVSATGRNRIGINTFENFIQTDAAINFGNSGGALINHRGELVGINAARLESEGIGFAIPTTIALDVASQIARTGSVERGWLGLDARDLNAMLKASLGVEHGIAVLDVLSEGPAARAGIRPGDVLTHFNQEPIIDSRTAGDRIAAFRPGESIALGGVRDGAAFTTSVVVSRRPRPAP